MPYRLVVDGRVVRSRAPVAGKRPPKARWVLHVEGCEFAAGASPLATLVAEVGEHGVLARVQRGLVARCKTCRPALVEPAE